MLPLICIRRQRIMRFLLLYFSLFIFASASAQTDAIFWQSKTIGSDTIYYTSIDTDHLLQLENQLSTARSVTKKFFKKGTGQAVRITIFPDRTQLDAQWSKDWNSPDFRSECWMVASGIATRLDILSPRTWNNQACEHDGKNNTEIQQVITHEWVHVFHAQQNPSPTFEGMDSLSWLIEGLATYVSGQLTPEKLKSVRQELLAGNKPASLSDFWKGKLRYQQAGSLMKFIDEKYGRKKLMELLSLGELRSILKVIDISEKELIDEWDAEVR